MPENEVLERVAMIVCIITFCVIIAIGVAVRLVTVLRPRRYSQKFKKLSDEKRYADALSLTEEYLAKINKGGFIKSSTSRLSTQTLYMAASLMCLNLNETDKFLANIQCVDHDKYFVEKYFLLTVYCLDNGDIDGAEKNYGKFLASPQNVFDEFHYREWGELLAAGMEHYKGCRTSDVKMKIADNIHVISNEYLKKFFEKISADYQ